MIEQLINVFLRMDRVNDEWPEWRGTAAAEHRALHASHAVRPTATTNAPSFYGATSAVNHRSDLSQANASKSHICAKERARVGLRRSLMIAMIATAKRTEHHHESRFAMM